MGSCFCARALFFRSCVVVSCSLCVLPTGVWGSNASGRRIVLLPGTCWAHGASKMADMCSSLLFCILKCFRAYEGMLLPSACRTSHTSAMQKPLHFLRVFLPVPPNPLAPAPTFRGFRSLCVCVRALCSVAFLKLTLLVPCSCHCR